MLIESFHQGSPGTRRYCSLHRPSTRLVQSTGVVLCSPLGHEYYRTHRACVKLAERLANAGFPVMRFDYTGTGDSEGTLDDASRLSVLAQWQDEIAACATELVRREHVTRIALGGIRFGATLALLAAENIPVVRTVLLWDPVMNGAQYLSGLAALHRKMLKDMERFIRPRGLDECNTTERVGTVYGQALVRELEALHLPRPSSPPPPSLQTAVIAIPPGRPAPALAAWMRDVADVREVVTGEDYGWDDPDRIEEIVVDPVATNNLANAMHAVPA